jgi:hypothetical protein
MTPEHRPRRRVVLFPNVAVQGRRAVRRALFQQLLFVPIMVIVYMGTATSGVVRWFLAVAIAIGVVSIAVTALELIRWRGRSSPGPAAPGQD